MLSYSAAALLATSVFASHEMPHFSGIPLLYDQGGDEWTRGVCSESQVNQNQSPIDFDKVTETELNFEINGIEKWGHVYAPPSDVNRPGPDYSFEMFTGKPGFIPGTQYAPWTLETNLTLDAPQPIGRKESPKWVKSHLHTPAEHTIQGKHYDMEYRVAYGDGRNADSYIYLSIFFDRQAGGNIDNPLLTSIIDAWKTRDEENEKRIPADFALLANQIDMDEFYAYNGSNTDPSCNDGATFVHMTKVLPISEQQYEYFRAVAPENVDGQFGNNRRTQPRNLEAYPVFFKPSKKMMEEDMHDSMMEDKHMDMMHEGCGMMNMLMGSVCESASSIAVYLTPLAAAIAVAAF